MELDTSNNQNKAVNDDKSKVLMHDVAVYMTEKGFGEMEGVMQLRQGYVLKILIKAIVSRDGEREMTYEQKDK